MLAKRERVIAFTSVMIVIVLAVAVYATLYNRVSTTPIPIVTAHHDVAIIDVTPSKNMAYAGQTVNITVTPKNEGNQFETFNVTSKYDNTIIGTQTVTLAAAASAILTFNWNTTDVTPCTNYTIKAEASTVPGETDTADNTHIDGEVLIKLPGDIDGDGDVDRYDFGMFAMAYGSKIGDSNYNVECDLDGDGEIDRVDFGIFAINYGKSCVNT